MPRYMSKKLMKEAPLCALDARYISQILVKEAPLCALDAPLHV